MPQEGARNRERRLRPRFPEIEKAARRAAAKPEQGRGLITSFCSENKKMSEQSGLCSDMARPRGVEPPAYRLGDMFVELPAMSSHILLCISTMLRLLSISPVVQYSQLSEPFITKVIISKKLATIFQTEISRPLAKNEADFPCACSNPSLILMAKKAYHIMYAKAIMLSKGGHPWQTISLNSGRL